MCCSLGGGGGVFERGILSRTIAGGAGMHAIIHGNCYGFYWQVPKIYCLQGGGGILLKIGCCLPEKLAHLPKN